MSQGAAETVWLDCVVGGIQVFPPKVQPSVTTASVAVIIRSRTKGLSFDTLQNKTASKLEILFIKRAEREDDRWSGHVAFPGGRSESGESTLQTAIRETREEIGLNLDSPEYNLIGKVAEQVVDHQKFVVSAYVFVQTVVDTPKLKLNSKEVSGVRWVPVEYFLRAQGGSFSEVSVTVDSTRKFLPQWLRSLMQIFNVPQIHFPGLMLPPADSDDEDQTEYHLWGLTFAIVKDLFALADRYSSSKGWLPVQFLVPKYTFRTKNFVIDSILLAPRTYLVVMPLLTVASGVVAYYSWQYCKL